MKKFTGFYSILGLMAIAQCYQVTAQAADVKGVAGLAVKVSMTEASSPTPNSTEIKTPVPAPVQAPAVQAPVQAATETPDQPSAPTPESKGLQILSPKPGDSFEVGATTIVVRSNPGQTVELTVNGQPVPQNLIGETATDRATKTLTITWYGVPLNVGTNHIEAKSGDETTKRQVMVRGAVTKIQLHTLESRIPADGRSIATVTGKLFDKDNNPASGSGSVTLTTDLGEFSEPDADLVQPGFQVKVVGGEFQTKLRSTLTAGTVTLGAETAGLQAFTQIQFETDLRPSIATGVVDFRLGRRGTNFYGRYRDFLPSDRNNQYHLTTQASAFATGKVGDWLLTGAFNSTRALNESCDGTVGLYREKSTCIPTYATYGDKSTTTNLTPSKDSLYLRLERTTDSGRLDYGLWGDYSLEEFTSPSQEFTAVGRSLHGLKLNYNLGNLQASGFYSGDVEGFQRDTIIPDGTSGYYFLSRRLLVEGTENIFLETEELDRPGTVIERKRLNRGPDYEIDYDRGSILFQTPVLRTDVGPQGEPLVRRIVTTYEYESPGSKNKIWGGRLRYHLGNARGDKTAAQWIGATYMQENLGDRKFELFGADAYIALGKKGNLTAEIAKSNHDSIELGRISGMAYRVTATGELAKNVTGKAYYRSADSGFSNNTTVSFVPGQRRYGAEVKAKLAAKTSLNVQYDHEDNNGTAPLRLNTLDELFRGQSDATPGAKVDNSLSTFTVGIHQQIGQANLNVDYLHRDRKDNLTNLAGSSDQLRTRLNVPVAKNLSLFAQNETTLSKGTDGVVSDRNLVGLNWQTMPGMNVQLAQQFYTRGQRSGQAVTSLSVTNEYRLGPNTDLFGRYSLLKGNRGMTTQASMGLKHWMQLTPGLRADVAYEHIFGSGGTKTAAGGQDLPAFTPGQSAASLGLPSGDNYSLGLAYNEGDKLQANIRYEHRFSSTGRNAVINAGITGKLSPAVTGLIRYHQASAANVRLEGLGDTAELKVGLAYREPQDDRFNALLRYEYRRNPALIPETLLLGSGTGSKEHLFGLEMIYTPSWRWELYGKFALRSSTTDLSDDFSAHSLVTLGQAKATYHFDPRWDAAIEARWIGQPTANYSELGWGIEAGYFVSPNLRLGLGYSFGKARDRDFGSTRSAGGLYLGVTVKLDELFNGFGLQKVPQAAPKETVTATK
jgi:hypothetical protein